MERFKNRRKNYYINKKFQRNFILKFCGLIVLEEQPRPEAAGAIAELHALGLAPIVMLTGDTPGAAHALAAAQQPGQSYRCDLFGQ